MPLQHVVKRGDSLWGLAGRHLGNFARWPELVDYHNDEVRKSAGNRARVFPIKDPNLIFVGQILYLPIRDKHLMRAAGDTGTKAEAGNLAVPIDLRIEYAFGHDGPPIVYIQEVAGHTIKTEMIGKIVIQIVSPDRYRHNLELALSKDESQCKLKLKEIYHPAFCALAAMPVLEFKVGEVIIKSPIAAMANENPFVAKINSYTSGKYTGSLKPKSVTGHVAINGIKFAYCAEIEFSVNVQNNPGNRANPIGQYQAPPYGDSIGYDRDFGGPGSWNSSHPPYKKPQLNLQDYAALTYSGSVFGDGFEINKGNEQKTLSLFDLGGASINLYLGKLPRSKDLVSEIGLGLGRHLGIGYFFGNPDKLGNMQFGGLLIHIGLGIGTPVFISGTFPEGSDPFARQMKINR